MCSAHHERKARNPFNSGGVHAWGLLKRHWKHSLSKFRGGARLLRPPRSATVSMLRNKSSRIALRDINPIPIGLFRGLESIGGGGG